MLLLRCCGLAAICVLLVHFFGDLLSEGLLTLHRFLSIEPLYVLYQAVRFEAGVHYFLNPVIYLAGMFVVLAVLFTVISFSTGFALKRFRAKGN